MIANTGGDWLKRYWLWFVLAAAFGIYALTRLLPAPKGKEGILAETKEKAEKLKTETAAEHAKIVEEMDAKLKELIEIKAITDEKERLQKLADFANRRTKR